MEHSIVVADPAEYVAQTLSRVTIAGAEPYFLDGSSDTALLVLHGWSASAESARFLADGFAKVGHSVLVPTLPGHGTSTQEMLLVGPLDWNEEARVAAAVLRRNYDKIVVVGISMGGALAIHLAAGSPEMVDGLVTVNAPVFMGNPAFAREIVSSGLEQPLKDWSTPSFYGEPVDEISYPNRFKKSGADLYAMCAIARELLPLVFCPLHVIQSVLDPVVPKASAEEILRHAGTSRKTSLLLERSYHISQLDLDRDLIIEAVVHFASTIPTRHRTAGTPPDAEDRHRSLGSERRLGL